MFYPFLAQLFLSGRQPGRPLSDKTITVNSDTATILPLSHLREEQISGFFPGRPPLLRYEQISAGKESSPDHRAAAKLLVH